MDQPAAFYVDRKGEAPGAEATEASNEASNPSKKRRGAKRAKAAVWVDEDDCDVVGNDGGPTPAQRNPSAVDLKGVPRRRKLRKSEQDTAVGMSEYERRVREYYAKEGTRIAAGTWAELPSSKRKVSTSGVGDSCEDSGSESSEEEHEKTWKKDSVVDEKVDQLLRSSNHALSARVANAKGQTGLRPNVLDIRRVGNANGQDPNRAVVQAVEFHPSGRMVMTAGLDKTMRLFEVDGKRNAKIQGVHLQDLPLRTAHFAAGGEEVIMMGRRPFFYQFDMGSGVTSKVETLARNRDSEKSLENCVVSPDGSRFAILGGRGRVVLASTKTKQQTGVLRMNTPCSAASFSASNANYIYTTGRGGTVHLWDIRKYACIDSHMDEGALMATSLASSVSHYATGSSSGVVNVYRNETMNMNGIDLSEKASDVAGSATAGRTEVPERAVLNLSTGISALKFNSDGRLLAFSSSVLKNAVRLLHVPSMTVYSNWPTQNVNLRRVSCLAFSPSSGFLAAGNDKGEALLFRIRSGYSAF